MERENEELKFEEAEDHNLASIWQSSTSGSKASHSSMLSVDSQLKEFKKKIMENNEPL